MKTSIKNLIKLFHNPALYDHPVDIIKFYETHISLVILTGQYVYKIKKPVDYGFLDFSSLAKRKEFCEEEVRINSRLAPDLYICVVPICGDQKYAKINGSGPIVEFAVKMHQFDTRLEFDKLLINDGLNRNLIEETAVVLANFHSNISIANETVRYGSPEVIHYSVLENFEQIGVLDAQWLATHNLLVILHDLKKWINEESTNLAATFNARKAAGFIRECHGDLHLRNIVLFKDRVTPFDGIEFNKNLSFIDVINDIAFLLMDLDDHGRHDLSRLFLNRYLSSTGDYAGLAVLNYYRVYRAMVRAKVAGLRLLQLGYNNDALDAEIENYLQLALCYIQPKKAKLIICYGSSGSGKTFISQLLIEKTEIIHIRSDVERKRIINVDSIHENSTRIKNGIYNEKSSDVTYSHLLHLSETVLKAGYSVLVDAAFLQKKQRQLFFSYVHSNNVPFRILHCIADLELQHQRLNERTLEGKDASDADTEILEYQIKNQESLTREEEEYSITVNNNGNPDLTQLVDWLEK